MKPRFKKIELRGILENGLLKSAPVTGIKTSCDGSTVAARVAKKLFWLDAAGF